MRRPPAALDPLIVGVLAAAMSLGGAGRPSFWYDEAATISASYSRSLQQLWQMLSNVTPSTGCTTCSCMAGFRSFRPQSSGRAHQAVSVSEPRRPE
jgi:mannosyltransferase